MSKSAGGQGGNPRAVLGVAILIFVAIGVFVYFAKRQQVADLAEHPALTHYVMAEGALVDRADEVALEDKLAKLDHDGAAQAIVVVEAHLSSGVIADDALQIARRYRVGHAGRNDGVVLLIAAQEKKARIEVGYGLEGALTDAQSRIIIANEIEPFLRKGDVSAAARHGVEAILALLHPAPFAEAATEPESVGVGWLLGVGLFLLVAVVIGVGVLQAIVLALPGAAARIGRSRRWSWFARVRILGGRGRDDSDDDRGSTTSESSSSAISSGGSFGGGGANN